MCLLTFMVNDPYLELYFRCANPLIHIHTTIYLSMLPLLYDSNNNNNIYSSISPESNGLAMNISFGSDLKEKIPVECIHSLVFPFSMQRHTLAFHDMTNRGATILSAVLSIFDFLFLFSLSPLPPSNSHRLTPSRGSYCG